MTDAAILRKAADLLDQTASDPTAWTSEIRSQIGLTEVQARSLTVNSDTSGIAPIAFARWLSASVEQYSSYATNAWRVAMTEHELSFPRQTAGMAASVVDEASPIPEVDPATAQGTLTALKYAISTRCSNEFLQDAVIDARKWLSEQHAIAIANAFETSAWAEVLAEVTNEHTAVTGNSTAWALDLYDVLAAAARLPNYARPQARVFCHPVVAAKLEELARQAGGSSVWHMENRWQQTFCGMPVVTTTALPEADGPEEVACVIGDLRQAAIFGDRLDARSLLADQTFAASDESLIITRARYAHAVNDASACVLLKTAAVTP